MTKLLVLGSSGMLGEKVVEEAKKQGHDVLADNRVPRSNIGSYPMMMDLLSFTKPEVVINCAGVIPGRMGKTRRDMVTANALGPWNVAAAAKGVGAWVIHVSTDCVFDGRGDDLPRSWRWSDDDTPDAEDLYGRSKALGEVDADDVVNVRTSFIGLRHGLVRWLIEESASPTTTHVPAWLNAKWTGSTDTEVARGLLRLLPGRGEWEGRTIHLATEAVYSKAQVLQWLVEFMGLNIGLKMASNPYVNRALKPTEGALLPDLELSIAELADEYAALYNHPGGAVSR
jgi:dTDP-4-dehydrorhamnose reductase